MVITYHGPDVTFSYVYSLMRELSFFRLLWANINRSGNTFFHRGVNVCVKCLTFGPSQISEYPKSLQNQFHIPQPCLHYFFIFDSATGWTGSRCDVDICTMKMCLHGGRCVEGDCICTGDYAGDNCELTAGSECHSKLYRVRGIRQTRRTCPAKFKKCPAKSHT